MKFEQLLYFLKIVKYRNYSIAADNSYISQSSLSKQIKKLETELSLTLFNRTTRSISLTPAGKAFYYYAKNIVEEYKKMKSNLKNYSIQQKFRINLVSIPIICQYGLFDMIIAFEKQFPDIYINIIEQECVSIIKYLETFTTDLIILRTKFIPDKKDFKIFPIMEDELVLVTNNNHFLSTRKQVSLNELSKEKFILLGPKTGIYDMCIEECAKAGFVPNTYPDFDIRLETIKKCILKELGVSLMMEKTAKFISDPNIRIIKLEESPKSTIAIISQNKSFTNPYMKFIEFAINYFKL